MKDISWKSLYRNSFPRTSWLGDPSGLLEQRPFVLASAGAGPLHPQEGLDTSVDCGCPLSVFGQHSTVTRQITLTIAIDKVNFRLCLAYLFFVAVLQGKRHGHLPVALLSLGGAKTWRRCLSPNVIHVSSRPLSLLGAQRHFYAHDTGIPLAARSAPVSQASRKAVSHVVSCEAIDRAPLPSSLPEGLTGTKSFLFVIPRVLGCTTFVSMF
jgi:hypothetical protein